MLYYSIPLFNYPRFSNSVNLWHWKQRHSFDHNSVSLLASGETCDL